MLIGEAIQEVLSLYNKGVQSDDSRLTPRHIYNTLRSLRNMLLSEKSKKRQKISQWNYQTLPCVELIKAHASECPCIPPIGCEILKTKYPIPKILTNYDSHLMQSVTTLDGETKFDEISWTDKKNKKGNKYTADKPDYFFRNNHLFITHKSKIKAVTMTGLFEDPIEVEKFPSFCPCTDCEDCTDIFDKEFPFDEDGMPRLIEMAVEKLVVKFSQGMEDTTNNSRDTPVEQTK